MVKFQLALDTEELFHAQAEIGTKLKNSDEFLKLTERDQELVLEFLRVYSKRLHVYLLRNHVQLEEKPGDEEYKYIPRD